MELECTMDELDVVVLDNGSGYIKVGFSGEDAPRAVIPTVVATSSVDEAREDEHGPDQSSGAQPQARQARPFYGDEALQQVNASLTKPVQRGHIVHDSSKEHEDAMESLWEYMFRSVLNVEQEELPILIADSSPLNQSALTSREWVADVMFEKFKVRSLAIFNTAVLSLFSTGRTRGLVVESGEGLTHAVPVFEGYAIPHAIFKMETAGQDITAKLQEMMAVQGCAYSQHPRVMQSMKEKLCSIALFYDHAMKHPDPADEESKSFELPDGNIIQVGHDVRMGAPEILFQTGPDERPSIQNICLQAIQTCDHDFRQDLIRSLVVAGGTSMLPGLAPRLKNELVDLLPADMARQVDICVDSQRKYAAWIGGSMFASLSTFEQVVITKQEFEEGKSDLKGLVARKTF